MGKKHKHPEHENLERWLVSYADFITLLFATFVVLYALGQLDLAKLKEVRHSLQQAFNPTAAVPAAGITGQTDGVMPGSPNASILNDSGNSIFDSVATSPKNIDVIKNPTQAQLNQQLNQSVAQINQEIQKLNQKTGTPNDPKSGNKPPEKAAGTKTEGVEAIPNVKVSVQERGIVISLSNTLFFEAGSAAIKPEAARVLDKLARSLNNSERMIHIEGHTDSAPIATATFPSNWELSSARASSVVRYLNSKHKIPSHRLAAIGYGQSRPAANNFSHQGRQQNRRVEIVLLSNTVAEATGEIPKTESKTKSSKGHKPNNAEAHSQTPVALHSDRTASSSPKRVIRVSLESKPKSPPGGSIIPDIAPPKADPRPREGTPSTKPAHAPH